MFRDPLANPEPLIPRVYAYVAFRMGHGPDAEDVTSETFERAVRYRGTYKPTKGAPITWLIGIARHCISEAAATREDQFREAPEVAGAGDLEEETVRRLSIRAAIAGLDERDQEVIALRFGADLTARQIAALLDERTNTIEVALHRALSRLRSQLESKPESDPVRIPAPPGLSKGES
jgi:RNA polymerase sigma-70 factor, ECF subfamily